MYIPSDSTYDFSQIGRRIQVRRKELGLTQEQLAEKVNCSHTHLARIENGYRPSLESLIRISTFLGYSLDELTGLYPAKNPYIQEVCNLFLSHSTEDQLLVLHTLRHIFLMLDQVEARGRRRNDKTSSLPQEGVPDDIWVETWNCRPV